MVTDDSPGPGHYDLATTLTGGPSVGFELSTFNFRILQSGFQVCGCLELGFLERYQARERQSATGQSAASHAPDSNFSVGDHLLAWSATVFARCCCDQESYLVRWAAILSCGKPVCSLCKIS